MYTEIKILFEISIPGIIPTTTSRQEVPVILTHIRHEHIVPRNIPTGQENQRALLARSQVPRECAGQGNIYML